MNRRRTVLAAAGLVLAARLALLGLLATSAFLEPADPSHDRGLYHRAAAAWAAGAPAAAGPLSFLPLYPAALSLVYRLLGADPLWAGLLGALLDAATAALAAALALRHGARPWAALLPAAAYALWPLAGAYAALTMPNTLNAFLVAALAVQFDTLRPDAPPWRWAAAGATAGVAALGFGGALPVAAAGAVFPLLRPAGRPARRLAGLAAAAVLALAPAAGVAAHNARAGAGGFVLTTHAGWNLFQGNHAGATGRPVALAGMRRDAAGLLADAHAEAERRAGGALSPAAASRFWTREAARWWRRRPADALRLYGRKLLLLCSRRDADDLRFLQMLDAGGFAVPLRAFPGFGWLALPALAGLFAAPRAGRLRAMTLAGMAALAVVFVTARYRLALAPLLLVLAALGLQGAADAFAGPRPPRRRAVGLAAAWLLAAACVLPAGPRDGRSWLDPYHAAMYLVRAGEGERALACAGEALRLAPGEPAAAFLLGNVRFALGDPAGAVGAYRDAEAGGLGGAPLRFNLAVALHRLGRDGEALAEARTAVRLDPDHERARDLVKTLEPDAE